MPFQQPMKVFVTGATGLVGSHAVRELISHGHEVRLLLRDLKFAKQYFNQFDIEISDYVIADMTNHSAVKKNLKGCDAVLHAAATIGLGSQNADQIYHNNYNGTTAVIGSAVEFGIRNILYISSLSVMYQPRIRVINEETPLGGYHGSYCLSKMACEQYVRELQKEGAPIQIAYPGGVFGPNDPRLNETNRALLNFVTQGLPITTSGIQIVDVRDLAKALRLMLERAPTRTPLESRLIVAGHYYPWNELHEILERVTGFKIRRLRIPGVLLRIFGSIADVLTRYYPSKSQLTSEAAQVATRWVPGTSQRAKSDLGIEFRDGELTFQDTLRWLRSSKYLSS